MQWACHNSHPRPGPTVDKSQPLVTLSHTVARSLALSPLWGLLAMCIQVCYVYHNSESTPTMPFFFAHPYRLHK